MAEETLRSPGASFLPSLRDFSRQPPPLQPRHIIRRRETNGRGVASIPPLPPPRPAAETSGRAAERRSFVMFKEDKHAEDLESTAELSDTRARLGMVFSEKASSRGVVRGESHDRDDSLMSPLRQEVSANDGVSEFAGSRPREHEKRGTHCFFKSMTGGILGPDAEADSSFSRMLPENFMETPATTGFESSVHSGGISFTPRPLGEIDCDASRAGKEANVVPCDLVRRLSSTAANVQARSGFEREGGPETRTAAQPARTMPLRVVQRRRLKKDAASIYSLMLPTFDDITGTLGCGLVFPRSLPVDVAVQSVLRQERGVLRTKASGVGITRFLAEFSESHEIIYLYFWYIVAHIRRVSTENMLIGRYNNLDRVIRGAFPRYKAELLPIDQLEWVLSRVLHSAKQNTQDTTLPPVKEEDGLASLSTCLSAAPVGHALSGRRESNCPSVSPSVDKPRSARTVSCVRRSRQRNLSLFKNFNMSFGQTSEQLLMQDPTVVTRCTEAIDAFTVLLRELCELSAFAQLCFHRLAILFGQAFERLSSDKDSILGAFTFIVPHVTYYVMMHCFPNDAVAGLFNAPLRMNLYRIFYFWCSGFMVTYVRTSGWPVPFRDSKENIHEASDDPQAAVTARPTGRRRRSAGEKVEAKFLDDSCEAALSSSLFPNAKKRSACPLQKEWGNASGSRFPNGGVSSPPRPPSSRRTSGTGGGSGGNTEDSFEKVDVEVANGHHRLILEFQRYASHVKSLVQELENRTMAMHRGETMTVTPTAAAPPTAQAHVQLPADSATGGSAKKEGKNMPASTSSQTFRRKKEEQNQADILNKLLNMSSNNKINSSYLGAMYNMVNPARNSNQHVSGVSGEVKNEKDGVVLPEISTQSKNLKTSETNLNCVLSEFPIEHTAVSVKRYIMREAGKLLTKAPLPPLDGDTMTTNATSCGKGSRVFSGTHKHHRNKTSKRNSTTNVSKSRSAKRPLPLVSPFFVHYAKKRFCKRTDDVSESSISRSMGVSLSPSVSACLSPMSTMSFADTLSPCSGVSGLGSSLLKPSNVPKPPRKSSGSRTKPLLLPHSTEKAINVMHIAPRDAHLRPLQFRGLTKEVKRRQLAHEREMDKVAEREQRLRQQYEADNHYSVRCVNKLLGECQPSRLETEAFRGLLKRKNKKMQSEKRRGRRATLQEV